MVSPTDLDMEAPPALHPHSILMHQDSQSLSIRPMQEDERDSVAMFLSQLGIDGGWADTALHAGSSADRRVRVVAELEGVVFGFSSWRMIGESDLEIHLFVDEQAPQSARVVDHILEVTQRRGSSHELGRSVVYCPLVQVETRLTAMRNGFQIRADATYSNSITLARAQFPVPVLETAWQRLREECDRKLGWSLPLVFPPMKKLRIPGFHFGKMTRRRPSRCHWLNSRIGSHPRYYCFVEDQQRSSPSNRRLHEALSLRTNGNWSYCRCPKRACSPNVRTSFRRAITRKCRQEALLSSMNPARRVPPLA